MNLSDQIKEGLKTKIDRLKEEGGRLGAWTIDAADDANRQHRQGGMGMIVRGHRMTMSGKRQNGAIKFQLPSRLPDGTQLFERNSEKFRHENNILEYLNQRTQNSSILRNLDRGSEFWTFPDGLQLHVPYFVTEYMEGGNLYFSIRPDRDPVTSNFGKQVTSPIKPLKGQDWLNLAYDLSLALLDMHGNRVVHQDLKPENVMIHNGRYVLVDFGLASYINYEDPGDSPGGTLGWMPPEQLFRVFGRPSSAAESFAANQGYVDVYAIGATLAFASSGTPPWEHVLAQHLGQSNPIQFVLDKMMTERPHIANLNTSQTRLIEAMMHPNYGMRPSAQECVDRIARMMSPTNSRKREYASRFGHVGGALPRLPSQKQYVAQRNAHAAAFRKEVPANHQLVDWNDLYNDIVKISKSIKVAVMTMLLQVKSGYKKFQSRISDRTGNTIYKSEAQDELLASSSSSEPAFEIDASGNPIFPASWVDVRANLHEILAQVGKNRFIIDIESRFISGIFFQGYFESDGAMTVECAADLSVNPKITKQQLENMKTLGWESPSTRIPNFIKFLDVHNSNPESVSALFVSTLRDGYGIPAEEVKLI